MSGQADQIFLIEGEQLVALPARPFRAGLFGKTREEALQTLIERYPDVLPGRQMDPGSEDPPRFVLLRREMPVSGWSLDHLLVDQRGVLTLVETKLIENLEARREVIGQIIEYAANALLTWGYGRAREKAAEYWSGRGKNLDDILQERFGQELEIESFWKTVEENLRQGRIRLLVVADELRPEVRRMIEYLNAEMNSAEVFGVEVRCYGEDTSSIVLVPQLIGQTQANIDRTPSAESPTKWPVERLQTAYDQVPNRDHGERLRTLLEWAVREQCFLQLRGKSPAFGLQGRGGDLIFSFSSDGTIWWYANAERYPGRAQERDKLHQELQTLDLVDPGLDPQTVVSGRNLPKKLFDLSSEEFTALLAIFSRFCGTSAG